MATIKRLPRFIGNWEYRLQRIFGCGVSYSGKRVLDAGCNVGILAYEIGKKRPALINGIDDSGNLRRTRKTSWVTNFPAAMVRDPLGRQR